VPHEGAHKLYRVTMRLGCVCCALLRTQCLSSLPPTCTVSILVVQLFSTSLFNTFRTVSQLAKPRTTPIKIAEKGEINDAMVIRLRRLLIRVVSMRGPLLVFVRKRL